MTKAQIEQALLTEQRCPKCNKLITDMDEVVFLLLVGMCGTCDHVAGDLIYIKEEEDEN